MLQSEYDELESEHERLTARHSKLIQDIDNKEAHWKDRSAFFTIFIHRGCGLNLTDRKKQKTFIPFPGLCALPPNFSGRNVHPIPKRGGNGY